jgi:hypothetical protein
MKLQTSVILTEKVTASFFLDSLDKRLHMSSKWQDGFSLSNHNNIYLVGRPMIHWAIWDTMERGVVQGAVLPAALRKEEGGGRPHRTKGDSRDYMKQEQHKEVVFANQAIHGF